MANTPSSTFSVKGKTAIVTGAGSGINYTFAKLLLSKGCNVVIADISLRPEAQKLVDDYTANPACVFAKTDVRDWDQLNHMFEVADARFGGAHIVCPGAGVYEPHWSNFWKPPGTADSKDPLHGRDGVGSYATLDINITHPIRTTQIAICRWLNATPKVSPSDPRRIVHISSIAGQTPGFGTPLYTASKHAISGFIRSLAPLEAKLGIRVNGVAPGVIKTPLWTDHPEKIKMIDEVKDTWVEPEEVAEAMLKCVEHASSSSRAAGVPKVAGTEGSETATEEGWGAGDVMEVAKSMTRVVGWRNDPGPSGKGNEISGRDVLINEAFAWLGEEGWGVPAG